MFYKIISALLFTLSMPFFYILALIYYFFKNIFLFCVSSPLQLINGLLKRFIEWSKLSIGLAFLNFCFMLLWQWFWWLFNFINFSFRILLNFLGWLLFKNLFAADQLIFLLYFLLFTFFCFFNACRFLRPKYLLSWTNNSFLCYLSSDWIWISGRNISGSESFTYFCWFFNNWKWRFFLNDNFWKFNLKFWFFMILNHNFLCFNLTQ